MKQLLGAAIVVLALAGCAPATGEQAFIDRMKADVRPPVDSKGQPTGYDSLVEIGHEVCAEDKPAAEVTESWAAAGFRPGEATAIVESAVLTLCPERKAWLGG